MPLNASLPARQRAVAENAAASLQARCADLPVKVGTGGKPRRAGVARRKLYGVWPLPSLAQAAAVVPARRLELGHPQRGGAQPQWVDSLLRNWA